MKKYQGNVFHRNLNKEYPVAQYSEGVYIFDTQGKKYLDGCSGALVSNVGHGNTEIIDNINKQTIQLAFSHMSQFTNTPLEEYASMITEVAPADLNYVYLVSGGSEANETAIKMARQYFLEKGLHSKYKVIARWSSYHGNTLGALSASGHVKRRKPHGPQLLDISHIEAPDYYRNPEADPIQYAELLEREIKRLGEEQVAAFILEPVTGSSNGGVYSPNIYYQRIREICESYNVLLIADEVMTGFGRTGKYFAVEHFGIIPDMITAGKGISGGYSPLAAVIVRENIFKTFQNGSGFIHGHTYTGNPISATAGLEVLKYLKKYNLVEQVAEKGELLKTELNKIKDSSSIVGSVRGLGLMIGIEFVSNKETKSPFPAEEKMADKIAAACFNLGLIIYPGGGNVQGVYGDTILIAPPFIISSEEIKELAEKLSRAIENVEKSLFKLS